MQSRSDAGHHDRGGIMSEGWMLPRITDYWDEQLRAVDAGARRLEAVPAAEREAAVEAICASVREHVRVLPDDLFVQAAIAVADDLYRAACATDRWDNAIRDYLTASAGTFAGELSRRGYRLQYLVDNAWEDMARPIELMPHWYQAAGFTYACPQLIAIHLAQGDASKRELQLVIQQHVAEARDVTSQLISRCQAEGRHFMQLDTDCAEDSFETAFRACEQPGVITIFRNEAPEPGTTVAVWLPGNVS